MSLSQRLKFILFTLLVIGDIESFHVKAADNIPKIARNDDGVTLSVWVSNNYDDLMKSLVFYYTHKVAPGGPQIDVKVMKPSDINGKLTASIASGKNQPDIVSIDMQYLPRFLSLKKDFVNLLDEPYEAGKYEDDFLRYRWRQGMSRYGRLFAMPWDSSPIGIVYRRDIFRTAGLPYNPDDWDKNLSSWDDYINIGTKLKGLRNSKIKRVPSLLNDATELFSVIRASQGCGNIDRKGTITIDDFASIKAYKYAKLIRKLGLDNRIQPIDHDIYSSIKRGDTATYLGGPWLRQILQAGNGPNLADKWGIIKLPGKTGVNLGGSFLAIPAQTKHVAQAWQLIEFICTTRESYEIMSKYRDIFPSYLPMLNDAAMLGKTDLVFSNQKAFAKWADLAKKALFVNMSPLDPLINDLLYRDMPNNLNNKEDAETYLKRVQQTVEKRIMHMQY